MPDGTKSGLIFVEEKNPAAPDKIRGITIYITDLQRKSQEQIEKEIEEACPTT